MFQSTKMFLKFFMLLGLVGAALSIPTIGGFL